MEELLLKLAGSTGPAWSWGILIVLIGLGYFIIKVTPSIVSIIDALGDRGTESEIKSTVTEIREQQKLRYLQQDAYQAKTDFRLDTLEGDVRCIKDDLQEIKGNCQNFHKEA